MMEAPDPQNPDEQREYRVVEYDLQEWKKMISTLFFGFILIGFFYYKYVFEVIWL